jgi:flagellar basal-body rod protein FlgG
MIKGIYTSGGSLQPLMQKMEIIANNLANMNTTGFKRDNMFVDMLKSRGVEMAKGKNELEGVNVEQYTDFSDGSLLQTNNPLNLALTGNGFFSVQTSKGVQYTRDGNFTLTSDGTIVTQQGYPVLGVNGKIQIPDADKLTQGSINISETGDVTVDNKLIAKLCITTVDDMSALEKEGASLYSAENTTVRVADNVGTAVAVHQGFLEESNVNGLQEMISMIELNRNYEANQKIIQAQDSTLSQSVGLGRVS